MKKECILCGSPTNKTVTYYGEPYEFEYENGMGDIEVPEVKVPVCVKCQSEASLNETRNKLEADTHD